MIGVKFVMTGDKKINEALKRLTSTQARRVIREAARPSLKAVRDYAKAFYAQPSAGMVRRVGRRYKFRSQTTGAFSRSIAIRAIPKSRRYVGAMVTTREGMFKGETYYGGFQEFGWEHHKSNRKIRGRHGMLRAARKRGPAAVKEYRERIWLALQRIWQQS